MQVEWKVLKQNSVDDRGSPKDQQRVSVGRRIDHSLDGNVATGAWPVFNDDLLTEPLRQPRSHNPSDSIGPAARSKSDDPAHRSRRIRLRPRNARDRRQRGGPRCQMQKLSAEKVDGGLPGN